MSKRIFTVLGVLGIIAAVAMYFIGKESSHMSELKDFWWIPAVIGVICLLLAGANRKTA